MNKEYLVSSKGIKTPITYYGGKQSLLKNIVPLIDKSNASCYVEPFVGGAAVFFGKNKRFETEVLNDINGSLINLYNVIQTNCDELLNYIDCYGIKCEYHYKKCRDIYRSENYTNIERACAMYYCYLHSFCNKFETFGYYAKNGRQKAQLLINRIENLKNARAKLFGTQIFNRDAMKITKRYEAPNTIFYFDPPYINTNCNNYEGKYSYDDYNNLLDFCANTNSEWILSSYKNKYIEAMITDTGCYAEYINTTNRMCIVGQNNSDNSGRVEVVATNIAPYQTQLF